MDNNTYIIVADKFADFTVNDRTITQSQAKSLLALPDHLLPSKGRLLLGQGVSDGEVAELVELVEKSDSHRGRWDITALKGGLVRAEGKLSHKRNPCNTLICPPVSISEDQYRLDLCVDHNCELMNDHQTGQHIQGMILVEAARQAFLAVTEEFFLKDFNRKSYFVINDMTSNFLGFVFPLPAHMEYRVVSKDINERRQKFRVEIELVQAGEVKVRTLFAFIVYPDEVISEKEAALAMQAASMVVKAPLSPSIAA